MTSISNTTWCSVLAWVLIVARDYRPHGLLYIYFYFPLLFVTDDPSTASS